MRATWKVLLIITMLLTSFCDTLFVSQEFERVNVKFIYGPDVHNQSQYSMHDVTQLLNHENFSSKRPTVLYVPGWTQSPNAETSLILIKAYLKRGDYNVLVLDWSDYSVGTYIAVMIRISKISRIFGRTMLKPFDKGLNVKSFHCVGHSFGAHSCGIMGRELYQVSHRRHKLGRITGLDPAGPGFFPTPLYEQPLSPSDAAFVDVIHSDVFFIGTSVPLGHADFFSNYNMVQPACPPARLNNFFDFVNLMCSHFNAVRYWVDSLNPKYGKLFASRKCSSWENYEKGKCSKNPVNYMGIEANGNTRGQFFIRLDSKEYFDGRAFYNWLLNRLGNRIFNLLSLNF